VHSGSWGKVQAGIWQNAFIVICRTSLCNPSECSSSYHKATQTVCPFVGRGLNQTFRILIVFFVNFIMLYQLRKLNNTSPSMMDQVLRPLTCIWEVLGSDLDRDTNYPDRDFLWFSWLLHVNIRTPPLIRVRPLPFVSFSIHYLLIIISFVSVIWATSPSLSGALQPFGPWPLFQFLTLLCTVGRTRRKAATYKQNNTNTE
jgi:hypothetical protein